MRIGTIFSGCGAPEQAASRVWPEHKIAFACEWDKFARQSYSANYEIDEAHFHTDVREMDGIYIGLEVKTADGKQSKEQKAIQDRITVAGGLYFIVRSVDDVKKIFEVKK